MPFQISPGVQFTENSFQTTVAGVSTSTAGYVGIAGWGPVDEIMTISSSPELLRRLSKPNDNNAKYFFVADQYLNYSNNLKFVRVIAPGEKNASSGGLGSGLVLTINATNSSVTSVTITTKGTGYVHGDIVTIPSPITPAFLRVTRISDNGRVEGLELLAGGEGHNDSTGVATTTMNNVLVKNDEDVSNDVFLPEVVARYPGAKGNSLMFSIVRASEFDNWAFKSRFVVAPDADKIVFDGKGTNTFNLPDGMTILPAGSIVTSSGVKIEPGTDPGQYTLTSGVLTVNTDTETFVTDGNDYIFNLANAYDLDTIYPTVRVNTMKLTQYTGVGPVPFGSFRASVGRVELGLNRRSFSGNGVSTVFTLTGATIVPDGLAVSVNNTAYTVITTGTPTANQVLASVISGTVRLTFAAGNAPAIGNQNIVASWGYPENGASVAITYGAPAPVPNVLKIFYNQTRVHAVVVDVDGQFSSEKFSLLERYDFLSLDPTSVSSYGGSDFYVTAINKTSEYVRLGGQIAVFEDKRLSGGVTVDAPASITSAVLQNGYNLFRNSQTLEVDHVIAGDASADLAQYLISSLGEYRRDLVVYVSPPFESVVNNRDREADACVLFRSQLPSSSYGTMDCAWKLILDPYNDKYRWVPLAGDHAGMYSLTHETYDAWFSGAGPNRGRIRNCIKLSWVPDQTDRDTLYKNGINPVASFSDTGPVLFGDKTLLGKNDPFDRMNVRWLFIALERAIVKAAKFYLFEFNDEFTRNQFKNTVHPFLRDVQGRRGITDFRVVCDDSNNTGSVIDRNEFVGDIYIKPARSINFIQLNFNAVGTDVSFDEIIR